MFTVEPLSQRDTRWNTVPLGFSDPNAKPPSTLGTEGCMLTCFTMVVNGFGADETPATMNEKLKNAPQKGFVGVNLLNWIVIPQIFKQVSFRNQIICPHGSPKANIQAALSAGMPVVVQVNFNQDPDPKKFMQHWILLVDKLGDDDYLILDPFTWPTQKQPVSLAKSRYCPPGRPDPILNAIFFTGTPKVKPSASVLAKTLPANPLIVFVSDPPLAFRSDSRIADSTLIDWMPLNTRLICLEPPEVAQQKIGQNNSWLEVQRDADGKRGYVLATYVSASLSAAQAAPEKPGEGVPAGSDANPTGLVVYAMDDTLTFRSKPMFTEDSLIRSVPSNTQFLVLDPVDNIGMMISQVGQWLRVRDILGTEGFVAAWLVSTTPVYPPVGINPEGPQPPIYPSNSDQLIVRTSDDNVALRRQSVISQTTLIRWMPSSTELVVLDPASDAEKKLGVLNQWLHVRDIYGVEGYVAAWFVIKAPLEMGTQ